MGVSYSKERWLENSQKEFDDQVNNLTLLSGEIKQYNLKVQRDVENLEKSRMQLEKSIPDEVKDLVKNSASDVLERLRRLKENFEKEEENLCLDVRSLHTILQTKDVNNPNLRAVKLDVNNIEKTFANFQQKSSNFQKQVGNLMQKAVNLKDKLKSGINKVEVTVTDLENTKQSAMSWLHQSKIFERDCEITLEKLDSLAEIVEMVRTDTKLTESFRTQWQMRKKELNTMLINLANNASDICNDAENFKSSAVNLLSHAKEIINYGESLPNDCNDVLEKSQHLCTEFTKHSEEREILRKDVQEMQNLLKGIKSSQTKNGILASQHTNENYPNNSPERRELPRQLVYNIAPAINLNLWSNQAIQRDGNRTGTISSNMNNFARNKDFLTMIGVIICIFAAFYTIYIIN